MSRLWIPGIMPVQFLLLFALLFVGGIVLQRTLTRRGLRITGLWQFVLFWIASYVCLTYVVWPPLPSHLFLTYLGTITVALFFFVSGSEPAWTECKQSIRALFTGTTPAYRLLRTLVFVALPACVYVALHNHMVPFFEDLIALRVYHSPSPRSFIVHGKPYFIGPGGELWVGMHDEHPSEEDQAGSVTVHIPDHLIGLTEGYNRIQIKTSSIEVREALSLVEAVYPQTYGQLRKRWGQTEVFDPYVNFFVVDNRGQSLGPNGYYVGSRYRCCHADVDTGAPQGSEIYIVPVGYDIDEATVDSLKPRDHI